METLTVINPAQGNKRSKPTLWVIFNDIVTCPDDPDTFFYSLHETFVKENVKLKATEEELLQQASPANAKKHTHCCLITSPQKSTLILYESLEARDFIRHLKKSIVARIGDLKQMKLMSSDVNDLDTRLLEWKFLTGTYNGEWRVGQPNGYGTFVANDGFRYEGYWNSSKLKAGVGKIRSPNNVVTETCWKFEENFAAFKEISIEGDESSIFQSDLTKKDLLLMMAGARFLDCQINQVIIQEGNFNQNLYIIESGTVKLENKKRELTKLGTNAIFGISAFLGSNMRNHFSVVCASHCKMSIVSTDILTDLFKTHIGLSKRFWKSAAREFADLLTQLQTNTRINRNNVGNSEIPKSPGSQIKTKKDAQSQAKNNLTDQELQKLFKLPESEVILRCRSLCFFFLLLRVIVFEKKTKKNPPSFPRDVIVSRN